MYSKTELGLINQALKNKEIAFFKTDTNWVLACNLKDEKNIEILINSIENIENQEIEIIIPDLNLLNIYVKQVPELAWDLIDFAEKPLSARLGPLKNIPKILDSFSDKIAIRLIKNEKYLPIFNNITNGIFTVNHSYTKSHTAVKFSDVDNNIIKLAQTIVEWPGKESEMYASTLLSLGVGGDIKFLRK